MQPVVVLVVALLVFRGLGALGVRRFATWPAAGAHALAVMLVITAAAHFVPESVTVMPNHGDMVRMVPPFVPFPGAVVLLTGVLELLGAAGLVTTRFRRPAGVALAVLFLAMLPANIHAALAEVPMAGQAATPLWLRVPEQIVFIVVALWPLRERSAVPVWAAR
ncbi:hypothetical protein [Nonomuraea longicatena]|uniref:DoxX family membrane protein n=1 Tax=Nonomuraea longicatena TaxID=83682 RepID=A0ABN1R324_9ACTN